MKHIYKLFASILVAWFMVVQASAVTVVYTFGANAWIGTNVFTGGATINSITLNTTAALSATNLVYALTDYPGIDATKNWGQINLTNTGYMQLSQYLTNITKTITNFAGLGQTTFPAGSTITNIITISNVLYSYTNYVGATSNVWRRVATGTLASNSIVTLTGPFPVVYGLGITNNNVGNPFTVTVDYDPAL